MLVDFSRIKPLLPTSTIDQEPTEMVRIYKYLCVHLDSQLKSTSNMNAVGLLSEKVSVN